MVAPGGRLAGIRLPIRTDRLSLRLPELSDVPFLTREVNDPDVFRLLSARHTPFQRKEEVAWVRSARRAAAQGRHLHLAVTLRDTGELIGGVGLEVRDWDNRRGFLGYWVAKRHWHRGYASEAASTACQLAFRRLRLHRIDAVVFEFNPRSMRVLRRLGFLREGVRREAIHRAGRWYGEVSFGLLGNEFRLRASRAKGPTSRPR